MDMTTRMEKVAENIALAALRKASALAGLPTQPEKLHERFRATWPTGDSRLPLNDAMSAAVDAAVRSANEQDRESWKTTVSEAWRQAVQEATEGYFDAAQRNFTEGHTLEGVENLTDAVRATLGHIAAARNWAHSTHNDLYRIAAALATGATLPGEKENLYNVLDKASEDGMDLCSALGASMGRPDMLRLRGKPGLGRRRRSTLRQDNRRAKACRPGGAVVNQEEHMDTNSRNGPTKSPGTAATNWLPPNYFGGLSPTA